MNPEAKREPIVAIELELPCGLSAKLDTLSEASCLDRVGVIAHLLDARQPLTLAEVLAPVHDDFRRSGMTEAGLDELLESELKAHREGR